MMKFFVPTVGLAALALALATPGVSDAGWRSWDYGYRSWRADPCWQGDGYRYRRCDRWINYDYRYCCGYTRWYGYVYPSTYVYPVQGYVSTQQAPAANTASIRVTVPAGARVWFNDEKTTQTGSERLFESPPLSPGAHYSYHIKAQWRDQDGEEVIQTQRAVVSAGANVSVDFRPLAGE
jgi:uncharacterized protein (TIGR03000 family)